MWQGQRAARSGSLSAPTSLCCGQGAPVLPLRDTRLACVLSVRGAGPVLGSHVEALDFWLPTKPTCDHHVQGEPEVIITIVPTFKWESGFREAPCPGLPHWQVGKLEWDPGSDGQMP